MESTRRARLMAGQLRAHIRANDPYCLIMMDEDNINIWYALIAHLDGDWEGGEYMFKLTLPPNFPINPPSLEVLTPNGLYVPGGKICVSIGEFHKQNWRRALGIHGFVRNGIVNGFICFDVMEKSGGIRLVASSSATKRHHAAESKAFNRKYFKKITEQFDAVRVSRGF